jgi:uncharacterized protein (TIGR00255 family)
MTGHGSAHRHAAGVAVAVELRTVNNRYFKLSLRSSEGYAALEPLVEEAVRKSIKRGTVQVDLRIDRELSADDVSLNLAVLQGYREKLKQFTGEALPWEALLELPGVVLEKAVNDSAEDRWPLIAPVLEEALARHTQMRRKEGDAMARDLKANCREVTEVLDAVAQRAPAVVEAYRARLTEKINVLLADLGVRVGPADVVREVGLFAERCDISEEIVRLRSHLQQFDATLAEKESNGRKLDFVVQEMFRETNTIGSKANDAEIARHVVQIKTAIERIREMIQNVE